MEAVLTWLDLRAKKMWSFVRSILYNSLKALFVSFMASILPYGFFLKKELNQPRK